MYRELETGFLFCNSNFCIIIIYLLNLFYFSLRQTYGNFYGIEQIKVILMPIRQHLL